jgi:hypothetical protein
MEDLAMEALAKGVVTFVAEIDFIANFKIKTATHREAICIKATLETKDTIIIIYANS